MRLRTGIRTGLIIGGVTIFLILIGVPTLAGGLVQNWFKVPEPEPGAWFLLAVMGLWAGWRAATGLKERSWGLTAQAGIAAGAVHALLIGALVYVLGLTIQAGVDLRVWLAQLGRDAIELLTLGRPPLTAAGLIAAMIFSTTLLGAFLGEYRTQRQAARTMKLAQGERSSSLRERFLAVPSVAHFMAQPYSRRIPIIALLAVVLIAPLFLGQYWNYTLGTVGIYVILGLGLNIVVGMAGLLDLGYVAFFAVGAYTMAILTAPQPHNIQMSFWLALPIGVVLAALTGILLGIPVLRLRGDYLAIVTLGFGEIIRILSKSDVLLNFTGGPRGIRAVGHPTLFGNDIGNEFYFMYIILLAIILAIFVTIRLENSRVGRAWRAMREDEPVAQAMGIDTLKYKLMAFAIGAAFAGLAGGIFASRNSFTGPEDFILLVSINVLALVIVGGMGSIPGVIMGALVLKGLPEILRELQDYRVLAFGALLVLMMIIRPEGIWPAARPQMERPKREEEARSAIECAEVPQHEVAS